jgi:hypothetical protein
MAFQDNSGDIILDAVLTDAGRRRMAKADGSFRIVYYAFGDDEINYGLYDKTNTSGSAYYDVQILQTPILEAFTDNAISLKSKLVSYGSEDLLYLPVVKLNELTTPTKRTAGLGTTGTTTFGSGSFVIPVNNDTLTLTTFKEASGPVRTGVIDGRRTARGAATNFIRLDQGIDNSASSPSEILDPNRIENSYIIEMDNRLVELMTTTRTTKSPSFIDDDDVASYSVTVSTDPGYFESFPAVDPDSGEERDSIPSSIAGQRGTRIALALKASSKLVENDYYFDTLGTSETVDSNTIKYIDTYIRITGGTTGYRVDVPVRFVKKG